MQTQAKELKQHQPGCKCYIVLCKCDLLKDPPKQLPPPHKPKGIAADALRQETAEEATSPGSADLRHAQDAACNSSGWVEEKSEKASENLMLAGREHSEDAPPKAEESSISKSGQDAKPQFVETTLLAGNVALSSPRVESELLQPVGQKPNVNTVLGTAALQIGTVTPHLGSIPCVKQQTKLPDVI